MQFSLITLRNLAFVKHKNACECTTGNYNEFMCTKREKGWDVFIQCGSRKAACFYVGNNC